MEDLEKDKTDRQTATLQPETDMRRLWLEGHIDTSGVSDETVARMKARIDAATGMAVTRPPRRVLTRLMRGLLAAAAIAVPLLMLTTYHLYKENAMLKDARIALTTGPGERATMTLPDGTQVTLNHDSRLVYSQAAYNRDERRIDFKGEAFFSVAKDKACPFFIDAEGLQVKVTGTAFGLSARPAESTARLELKEGSVEFTSLRTGQVAALVPGQRVTMDYATGALSVESGIDTGNMDAWKRGTMVFRDESLHNVLATIERVCRVKMTMAGNIEQADNFTGTLPTDDVGGCIRILEKAYGVKFGAKKRP